MEYRTLGPTELRVAAICVGVAFRGAGSGVRSDEDCVATIERAVEVGCNFLDCANVYGRGRSEEVLGRTLKRLGNRDELVVTTKVGSPMTDDPDGRGLSRRHILDAIEQSLRRLQMDHVDIYLLHEPDLDTPLEETLRAMDDVVRQGKARFVGVSNHPAAEVVELLWAADKHNLAAPAVIQYQYSLLHRWDAEESLVPVADRHGLGLMTYSPLAIGLLTGQVRAGQPIPADSHWFTRPGAAATLAAVEPVIAALVEVAREVQRTPAQVAVAWILANPTVSAAMIGPELPEHIDELIGAVGWQLPLEAKARLDAAASDQGPNELLSAGLHRAQPRKHRR